MTSPTPPREPGKPQPGNPWGQPNTPQQPAPQMQPSANPQPNPQTQPSANPQTQPSANPQPGWGQQPSAPWGQPPRGPQGPYAQGPYGQPQPPRPGQPGPWGQQVGPQGQPMGPQGQPMGPQGFAQRPMGAAPAPGSAPQKSKLPIIIGAAVVGLVVLALLASQLLGGKDDKSTTTTGKPAATSTAGGERNAASGDMSTPEGAAQAFMDALVAGDADALLATLRQAPDDDTFITNEVLKQSAEKKAITDVQVSKPEKEYGPVKVSYKVAGKQVTDKLNVLKGADDKYKVSHYLPSIGLYEAQPVEMGMKVNGVAVTEASIGLLPGVYDITVDNAWYGYDTKTLTVTSLSDSTSFPIKPALTPESDKKVRAAMRAQLAACMKQIKTLSTPECGVVYRDTAIDGTKMANWLQCSVAGGEQTIDKAKLRTTGSDPLQLDADIQVKLSCKAKTAKGQTGTDEMELRSAEVDLNGKAPKVTFQRY